jgi:hypothetical protein
MTTLAKCYEEHFNAALNALELNSRLLMTKYMHDKPISAEQKKWCDAWLHEISLKAEHFFDHQNDEIPVSKSELKNDQISGI